MSPNPGYCPQEAEGKRVRVRLALGGLARSDSSSTSPPGWAADGRGGCRWSIIGSPFDISHYEVIR